VSVRACDVYYQKLGTELWKKKLCTLHLQKISNWTNFCSYQAKRTPSLPFQFERTRSIRNENMRKMRSFNIYMYSIFCSLKLFPEQLHFWEIQNSINNFPCANIHFCQWLQRCWKHSLKPFCESFSALSSHS